MVYNFKKICLSLFARLLTLLTIIGVNSACNIVYGQPNEPQSLACYKKR